MRQVSQGSSFDNGAAPKGSWFDYGAGPWTWLWTGDIRNRILQLESSVATPTVGCRHDLAAEAANHNMKPLTVEFHEHPTVVRPPTSEGSTVLTEDLRPLHRRQALFLGQLASRMMCGDRLHVLSTGERVLEDTGSDAHHLLRHIIV